MHFYIVVLSQSMVSMSCSSEDEISCRNIFMSRAASVCLIMNITMKTLFILKRIKASSNKNMFSYCFHRNSKLFFAFLPYINTKTIKIDDHFH